MEHGVVDPTPIGTPVQCILNVARLGHSSPILHSQYPLFKFRVELPDQETAVRATPMTRSERFCVVKPLAKVLGWPDGSWACDGRYLLWSLLPIIPDVSIPDADSSYFEVDSRSAISTQNATYATQQEQGVGPGSTTVGSKWLLCLSMPARPADPVPSAPKNSPAARIIHFTLGLGRGASEKGSTIERGRQQHEVCITLLEHWGPERGRCEDSHEQAHEFQQRLQALHACLKQGLACRPGSDVAPTKSDIKHEALAYSTTHVECNPLLKAWRCVRPRLRLGNLQQQHLPKPLHYRQAADTNGTLCIEDGGPAISAAQGPGNKPVGGQLKPAQSECALENGSSQMCAAGQVVPLPGDANGSHRGRGMVPALLVVDPRVRLQAVRCSLMSWAATAVLPGYRLPPEVVMRNCVGHSSRMAQLQDAVQKQRAQMHVVSMHSRRGRLGPVPLLGLTWLPAHSQKVAGTTAADYFLRRFGYTMQHPEQPAVIVGHSDELWPMETCHILPAMTGSQSLPAAVVKKVRGMATMAPSERLRVIKKAFQGVRDSFERQGDEAWLQRWGLHLQDSPGLCQADGWLLPSPKLLAGQKKEVNSKGSGAWASSKYMLHTPAALSSCAIVCCLPPASLPESSVCMIMSSLRTALIVKGVRMLLDGPIPVVYADTTMDDPPPLNTSASSASTSSPPPAPKSAPDSLGTAKALALACKQAYKQFEQVAQLIIVLVPSTRCPDTYRIIKQECDCNLGLQSQVLAVSKIPGLETLAALTKGTVPAHEAVRVTQRLVGRFGSVALKINAKLGGANLVLDGGPAEWCPALSRCCSAGEQPKVMFIGMAASGLTRSRPTRPLPLPPPPSLQSKHPAPSAIRGSGSGPHTDAGSATGNGDVHRNSEGERWPKQRPQKRKARVRKKEERVRPRKLSHSAPGPLPSVVAIVASVDRACSRYASRTAPQLHNQPGVGHITWALKELLDVWRAGNKGALPDVLVLWRQGLGQPQAQQHVAREVAAMHEACEAAAAARTGLCEDAPYTPRIIVLCVERRHGLQMFPCPGPDSAPSAAADPELAAKEAARDSSLGTAQGSQGGAYARAGVAVPLNWSSGSGWDAPETEPLSEHTSDKCHGAGQPLALTIQECPVAASDCGPEGANPMQPMQSSDVRCTPPTAAVCTTGHTFLLQSHPGSVGETSRPTRYTIMWDEVGLGVGDAALLCNHVCNTSCRATRAIAIPPPLQYARLAARRAWQCWLEEEEVEGSEAGAQGSWRFLESHSVLHNGAFLG